MLDRVGRLVITLQLVARKVLKTLLLSPEFLDRGDTAGAIRAIAEDCGRRMARTARLLPAWGRPQS